MLVHGDPLRVVVDGTVAEALSSTCFHLLTRVDIDKSYNCQEYEFTEALADHDVII